MHDVREQAGDRRPPTTPGATGAPVATGVLGLAAVVLAVALTVAAAVLDSGNDPAVRAAVAGDVGWTAAVAGTALVVPGAVVLRRSPRHLLGWVLVVAGLHWAVDGFAASWLVRAVQGPEVLPGAELAFWLYNRLGSWLLLTLPLLLLLYPDGRLPQDRRWRTASLLSLAATSLLPLTLLVVPARIAYAADGEPLPEPLLGLELDPTTVTGLPDAFWAGLLPAALGIVAVSLVVPFAVVVRRYRKGGAEDRRRMRWLVWAGLVALVVMLSSAWLPDAWTSAGLVAAVTVTGTAVGIGVVRPGLVDIDTLLGGTVVYVLLGAALLLADLAVLAGTGVLLGEQVGERQAALLALALVAAVYLPLRDVLWRAVRRVVVGGREDPYRVVSSLAEELERSEGAQAELEAVARAVAHAFRAPYVRVEVDQPDGTRLLAATGTEPSQTRVLPVGYRGEEIGRLVLPARGAAGERLSRRDQRLLTDLVRQTAAAARAAHLAAQLQRSREQLVVAREEERRRLRRDLHDGLGPALGAVVLRVGTARNLAAAGALDDADALLREVATDVSTALTDVRRLVHDLRPPALDDVGLLAAVEQQAGRLTGGGAPEVRVRAEGDLASLPAAVEVAAYRIASEALHNVVRHAGATRCELLLARLRGGAGQPDRLEMTVSDDGSGIAADAAAGVGLQSLRERAAELGGTCQVTCPATGGTVVRAVLPVHAAAAPGAPTASGHEGLVPA
jgi:signal transduction histidine kinase